MWKWASPLFQRKGNDILNPVSDMEAVQRINEYIEGSSTSPFFVIVDGSELYNSILNSLVSLKKVRMSD